MVPETPPREITLDGELISDLFLDHLIQLDDARSIGAWDAEWDVEFELGATRVRTGPARNILRWPEETVTQLPRPVKKTELLRCPRG